MLNKKDDKIVYKDLSYKIIGLAMQVHKELGHGFLEKVYENGMMVLLRENRRKTMQQAPIKVMFHDGMIALNFFLVLFASIRFNLWVKKYFLIQQRKTRASGAQPFMNGFNSEDLLAANEREFARIKTKRQK